jgi:DNA-binding IclR family transcriptional regulator
MSELVARTGETAYLTVVDGLNALCLERVEGRQLVRVLALDVGKTLPLTTGGGPVAMLAFRPDLVDEVLAHGLARTTPDSIGDEPTLRRRLEAVRARGFAVSREDVTPGVCAIGAPVFSGDGQVVAALSVSGLAPRFAPSREPEIADEVTRAAGLLSVRLGYRPTPLEAAR